MVNSSMQVQYLGSLTLVEVFFNRSTAYVNFTVGNTKAARDKIPVSCKRFP